MAVPGSGHVVTIYDDDEAFLRLLEHSGQGTSDTSSLKQAAQIAYGPANTPTCCEKSTCPKSNSVFSGWVRREDFTCDRLVRLEDYL
jgi:hypothetical protein